MLKKLITLIILLLIIGGILAIAKNNRPIDVPKGKLPAGSQPVGNASIIQDQTWVWTETIANNDTSVTPKKAGAFTLTLNADGSANGTTDCNSFFTTYTIATDGIISFGPIGSTKMACEGSQEALFTDFISKTSRYTLDTNGNLVLLLGNDSGSVMFVRKEIKEIVLEVGAKGTFKDLSITLNKITQDSRCPVDVQCIQAGTLIANSTLSIGSTTKTIDLTLGAPAQEIGTYKVAVTEALPAKESKKEITSKDYQVTYHIE